jgi:hypothetical protein
LPIVMGTPYPVDWPCEGSIYVYFFLWQFHTTYVILMWHQHRS